VDVAMVNQVAQMQGEFENATEQDQVDSTDQLQTKQNESADEHLKHAGAETLEANEAIEDVSTTSAFALQEAATSYQEEGSSLEQLDNATSALSSQNKSARGCDNIGLTGICCWKYMSEIWDKKKMKRWGLWQNRGSVYKPGWFYWESGWPPVLCPTEEGWNYYALRLSTDCSAMCDHYGLGTGLYANAYGHTHVESYDELESPTRGVPWRCLHPPQGAKCCKCTEWGNQFFSASGTCSKCNGKAWDTWPATATTACWQKHARCGEWTRK
jgi:hypothetical protein